MNTIENTLDYILKSIVSNSDNLIVNSTKSADFISLEISAPTDLIGQIIGKQGKIIKAIRQLLNLSYPNQKYSLEILEPKA